MHRIDWSERYRIGHRLIDEQHRQLFRLVNDTVSQLATAEVDSAAVSEAVDAVMAYAREHFRVEEELMQATGYPDLDDHAAAHLVFTEKVAELALATQNLDPAMPAGLGRLLAAWLSDHVLTHDVRLRDHLARS